MLYEYVQGAEKQISHQNEHPSIPIWKSGLDVITSEWTAAETGSKNEGDKKL
ncbi:hypothetical protein PGT21_014622 [Puccinia graminis f. sp. tritici]|uniref:Uncharacterized protein n=1 Tax=Puccinia graminis f. sp. tritici TaxID=56615 RepID=A0A5B0N3U3_PUCGR|nr:hypothetical protein PGT21_014622 [Puccinia graminis f. sp. tritici]KAA1087999.1 hypothetical protein PGTUg99_016625 [Puccinia graminis f. sp. tritici]